MYQKLIELLTVTPADGIAALPVVTVIFIGMRLLYGAWPWESRKTWYHTKTFVPVIAPPEKITSEAQLITADTDSDHFDRTLVTAEFDQFVGAGFGAAPSNHHRTTDIREMICANQKDRLAAVSPKSDQVY